MTKRPTPPQRDRQRCRDCPLWEPSYDWQGNDVNQPVLDDKGDRIVKNGIPQYWKHKDGELVRWGICGAKLPERQVINGQVGASALTTRSDWFCESTEKHDAIHRLKLEGK